MSHQCNYSLLDILLCSAGPEFEQETDVWKAQYFSRAMNNEMWMFSASYSTGNEKVVSRRKIFIPTKGSTIFFHLLYFKSFVMI